MVALTEQLLPGPAAVENVTGQRPHYSTFFRWTQRGVLAGNGKRVRLGFVKAGSRRLTSIAAVRRFFDEITVASGGCMTDMETASSVDDLGIDAELSKEGL